MKKHNIILVLMLLSTMHLWAQDKIKFSTTKHDFGTIMKGDLADYTFTFTNVSQNEVKLQSVKASCGCTTPHWTQEPIKVNGTGDISVSYNTQRVGQFSKTVTVVYDTAASPIILTISGNVMDTTQHSEDDGHNHGHEGHNHGQVDVLKNVYKMPQGSLYFERLTEEIGIIDTDKTRNMSFKFRNMGKANIKIVGVDESADPVFTNVSFSPRVLEPGQEGVVNFQFDAAKFDQKGRFTKMLVFNTDDAEGGIKELSVTGEFNKVITEKEKAMAPRIEFEQPKYNAGVVIDGEKVVHKFRFKNTGASDLIIESAKGSCGCTVAEPKEKVIKPGESSEITATFDSAGRIGEQHKTVTVKSNDPFNENVTLELSVKVESDPFHSGNSGPFEKKK